jgi:hypothetical protein
MCLVCLYTIMEQYLHVHHAGSEAKPVLLLSFGLSFVKAIGRVHPPLALEGCIICSYVFNTIGFC